MPLNGNRTKRLLRRRDICDADPDIDQPGGFRGTARPERSSIKDRGNASLAPSRKVRIGEFRVRSIQDNSINIAAIDSPWRESLGAQHGLIIKRVFDGYRCSSLQQARLQGYGWAI